MKFAWAIAFCAVTLAACVPVQPPPAPVVKTQVYDESFDMVWAHLLGYFTSNNIQIKTIEKASGVLYAEQASLDPNANVASCGFNFFYIPQGMSADLNILVTTEGDKTRVTVNTVFVQTASSDLGTNVTQCASTGVIEKGILGAI